MIMALKTLNDALLDELKDLLSAEKQLTKALPKMAKKATHSKLQAAFETHLEQTNGHIERLNEVFSLLDRKPTSKTCEAMKGLLEEGKSIMEEEADPDVMDCMLIAAAQKVEHYEIASYGTVCAWAELLGLEDAHELLGEILNEEEETDALLSELALSAINADAVNEG